MGNLKPEKNSESIIIKPSLKKNLKTGLFMFFGSLFFILTGFYMLYKAEHIIISIISILFFGYGLYFSVRKYLFKGISKIYITKEGIKTKFFPMKKEIFVPWDAINDVWVQSISTPISTTTSLFISLKNSRQFFEKTNNKPYEKFLTSLSQLIMPKEYIEKIKEWTGKFDLFLNDDYEVPISELLLIIKSRIKK
ncbi:MAG: STM3941 family protein [Candidatus Aenigmatarchaeota archaeon]